MTMDKNHHAGSATSIDLAALTRYDSFETDDGDELRVEPTGRWVRFDDVAALARATPQHPDLDAAQLEPLLQNWFGLEDCKGLFNPGRLLAFANAARATTPQHSVTEQASIDTPEFRSMMIDYRGAGTRVSAMRVLKCIISHIDSRAKPLASTAATQPEQSSEIESRWVALLDAANAYLSLDVDPGIMIQLGDKQTWLGLGTKAQLGLMCDGRSRAEIDRAAPAIPASTAASEQQAVALQQIRAITHEVCPPPGSEYFTIRELCDQALTHRATTAADQQGDLPFRLVIDPTMPPNTMRMQSGRSSVTMTNIGAAADQQGDTASASIDSDPEFQRLAEYWRGEPYGTRSFLNAWDELVAHIDGRGQQGAAQAQAGADAMNQAVASIVRDVCELDYTGENWDAEKMLSVTVDDLMLIVSQNIAAMAAPATSKENR